MKMTDAVVMDGASPAGDESGAADTGQRILIVDDDRGGAEMLANLLRIWGHRVEVAAEGREAIESALEFSPQTILLDIDLPWLDGFEIAQLLRGDTAFKTVKIVALTGHRGDEYRFRALQAGFDRHMTKPVDIDALRAVLAEHSQPVEPDDV